jgi:hypothetical protein
VARGATTNTLNLLGRDAIRLEKQLRCLPEIKTPLSILPHHGYFPVGESEGTPSRDDFFADRVAA